MILFGGDSFTWGQGLEWELLISKGYTREQINKIIPPKYANERLPIELMDYREKNRWPRLVAEHFDTNYDLLRQGNGGSNGNLYHALQNNNFHHRMFLENLDLLVLQLTHAGRDKHFKTLEEIESVFNDEITHLMNIVSEFEKQNPHINVVIMAWLPEHGEVLTKYFNEKYLIKFNINNNIHYGFEDWMKDYTISYKYHIDDYHFNLEGNKIVAENVINHIEKYNLLQKNTFYENRI